MSFASKNQLIIMMGTYKVADSTPRTKDTIIHISAFLEALFAPSMSPAKYLELTCEEKTIAIMPGIKQQKIVKSTDQIRYVEGIGSWCSFLSFR